MTNILVATGYLYFPPLTATCLNEGLCTRFYQHKNGEMLPIIFDTNLFHPGSRNATFALARLDYKKMISKSETVVLIQAKRRVPWI